MLNLAFLRIQLPVSHLDPIWLWLHRVRASDVHVTLCWPRRAGAATPVIGVVDAHSAFPSAVRSVCFQMRPDHYLQGLLCRAIYSLIAWFEMAMASLCFLALNGQSKQAITASSMLKCCKRSFVVSLW